VGGHVDQGRVRQAPLGEDASLFGLVLLTRAKVEQPRQELGAGVTQKTLCGGVLAPKSTAASKARPTHSSPLKSFLLHSSQNEIGSSVGRGEASATRSVAGTRTRP
jgi:hypothetical protein